MTLGDTIAERKTALSVADVAGVLQTTSAQVRKLVAAGELPAMKIGKALRFDPQVFSDWLKAASTPKFKPLRIAEPNAVPVSKTFKSLLRGRQ
jgi:excisionase family DNA binding protein